MKEFIFRWRIDNFTYSWHKTGEAIFSPFFTAVPILNSIWSLQLYPRGYIDPDYLSVYLRRVNDDGPMTISINFEISCISAENSPLNFYKSTEGEKSFVKNGDYVGHPRFRTRHEVFIRRKALYLPLDVLTIRCRMWKDEGTVSEFKEDFGCTYLYIERISLIENINPEIFEEKTVTIHSELQNKSLLSISVLPCENCTRFGIKPTFVENIKSSQLKLWFMKEEKYNFDCSWVGEPQKEAWILPRAGDALDTGNKDSVENGVELHIEFVYSQGKHLNYLENRGPYSSRLSELVTKYIINCIPSGNLSDRPRICQNLWNWYEEQILCDMELKTETRSFFVHKIVLCARSPVFLAMLTGDMKEKRNKCIELKDDIKDDILEKFLHFLYTDTFEDLEWDAVIGLYYASDKYEVARLKILCCSYLLKNVNVGNKCELLALADKHYDFDFQGGVQTSSSQNYRKILRSSKIRVIESSLTTETKISRCDKEKGKGNTAEIYDEKLSKLPKVEHDLITAYQDKIVSDIIIKTSNDEFHVHKSMLCASSPTLKEKFTVDLKDKPTDVFKITDLEDDTVNRLLRFLYTDCLGDLKWDIAIKLYHAADVYQIQRLKIKCACVLLENLETSNVSELVLLAHEHGDAILKSVVEYYIYLKDEEIFGSDEWADFTKTNPNIAIETIRSTYKKH